MMRMKTLVLAAVATLLWTPAKAQEIRLGDFQSTTHIVSVEGTQKWMQKVKELTNGKVTFKHYPAEQAVPAAGLLHGVKNGILGAALIGPLYSAEVLQLNSVVGLPGFYTTAVQGTAAMQAMLADGPVRQELLDSGVVPVFGFVLPPYQILSKKVRLGKPAEWKGLKIRTSGSTQAMIARDLGSVGVRLSGPDVYTAVETGLLDGILFPLASVPGYNLQEVVKHISTNGSFGGYSFVMVVKRDLFDGLPDDVKQAMVQAGKEIATHVAKAQDESENELKKSWAAKGINVYAFTDEEKAALKTALAKTSEEWLSRIGSRNPKAKEVLAQYEALTKN